MSYYALTEIDWPWDDEHEGRAMVVEAATPQDAVTTATGKLLAEFPGSGGVTWKVAKLADVGFQDAEWEDNNQPNYGDFVFYAET
ncbi:MAG: hypothetical protein JWQ74_3557 [Marmoricola sp.]|nr:hypothetical protein [Marmoricola sp.]